MSKLVTGEITYFSQRDEDSFFKWLKGIQCVSEVRGVGRDLHITIEDAKVGSAELRELIGLFHRYGINKRQLGQFASDENARWFRDAKGSYWHRDIFG